MQGKYSTFGLFIGIALTTLIVAILCSMCGQWYYCPVNGAPMWKYGLGDRHITVKEKEVIYYKGDKKVKEDCVQEINVYVLQDCKECE